MDTDDVKPAERFALKTVGSPLHVTVGTPINLCNQNGLYIQCHAELEPRLQNLLPILKYINHF